jgi:hypothetical protein
MQMGSDRCRTVKITAIFEQHACLIETLVLCVRHRLRMVADLLRLCCFIHCPQPFRVALGNLGRERRYVLLVCSGSCDHSNG